MGAANGHWGAGTLQTPHARDCARPVWLKGKTLGREMQDQGSIPAAPRHLSPPLPMASIPSSPSRHQAQLSREMPMEKLASRSSPRLQGYGAGTWSRESRWDTNSPLPLPGIPSLAEAISPFGCGCRKTKAKPHSNHSHMIKTGPSFA